MGLRDQIFEDYINAYKKHNDLVVSVLRMLKAAISNKEISNRGNNNSDLSENDIYDILSKEVNKRQDAAEQYQNGNREELAQKELEEIKIIKKYLPEELGEEEIKSIALKCINETGAASKKDMGKVLSILIPQLKGKAGGALISKVVKQLLEG